MNHLIRWIIRLKQIVILQLFTIYLRYLIGGAFIIAAIGMGKLSGGVFLMSTTSQSLCDLQPLQQFFRVMAESGLYWQFIGWSQIIGGAMLMTQRFAKAGALIFFGLILNIFIITVSYEFKGTPLVTGMMLLATTYLLLWDIESFQFLIRRPTMETLAEDVKLPVIDHPFWSVLGVILVGVIVFAMITTRNIFTAMLLPAGVGLVSLVIFFTLFKKRSSGVTSTAN